MALVFNKRAFSLLEVLVAAGLSSIVLLAVSIPIVSEIKTRKNVESFFWLGQLRTEIVSSLKKTAVFEATVLDSRNPSMTCLKPKVTGATGPSKDCRGTGGPITVLKSAAGAELINNSAATSGLTEKGNPCSDFSDTSESCPFRIEMSWEPVCQTGGTCFNPDIRFEGKLLVSKAHKSPINPDLYGFRWVLPTTEKSDVVCDTSGIGTSSAGDCKMNVEFKCPAGKYLVGFQANGSPICKIIGNQTCPGGLLQGFDSVGKIVCGSTCK